MFAIGRVFALDLIAKVILGLTGIILIRVMPSEEYAVYSFAVAVIAMATEALVLSWRSIYVAGGRRFNAERRMGAFLAAQLLIIGAAVLMTLPLRNAVNGLYWVLVLVIAGRGLLELARGALQRALDFSSYAGVELVRAALLSASIWAIASSFGQGIRAWQALGLEAAGLLGVGTYLIVQHRSFLGILSMREAIRLIQAIVATHYRYFWAYLVVLALFGQMDVFMLRLLGGELALATYGSTLRYYALLSMVLAAVNVVFLPLAQRIEYQDDLNRLLSSHKKLVLCFTAVAFVAVVVAGWAIPWIDQGRYPGAVLTFRILAVSSVVSLTCSPYVNVLIRFEDFRFMLGIVLVGLLIDAVLNFALIPSRGASGAAVASSVAAGLVNTAILLRSRRFRGMLGPRSTTPLLLAETLLVPTIGQVIDTHESL